MIFSKRTIRTTSIPKIRKIHNGVWKLKAKNLQNCQFWPKKWPNFRHKWPNFGHLRIFLAYTLWFSQRRPQGQFPYQKLWKFIAAFRRYRPKNTQKWLFWPKMAKFWPFLAILGVKNFFRPNFFQCQSKWYGDLTSCQNQKKYQTVKAVGPELTYARTHIRMTANL